MKIDDNHYLEKDDWCITLVRTEVKKRPYSKKGTKKSPGWKEGEEYVSEDRTFYPNVKLALKKYLDFKISESTTIEEIVSKIEEVEESINNLKVIKI